MVITTYFSFCKWSPVASNVLFFVSSHHLYFHPHGMPACSHALQLLLGIFLFPPIPLTVLRGFSTSYVDLSPNFPIILLPLSSLIDINQNFINSTQPKDCPVLFTAHGSLMRIEMIMHYSTLWPKVGRYSKAVLVMCISNVQCVTILQYHHRLWVQDWQPDSSLTLSIKEGTAKEMPNKNRIWEGCQVCMVALVRFKELNMQDIARWASHLPTLW